MADDELTQAVLRYTGTTHQRTGGITATRVRGLYLVRRTAPSALEHAVEQPLVCLVLQGRKRVAMGSRTVSYVAGDTMIVTANVPTASRISQASIAQPYLAVALELDPAVITDLVLGSPGGDVPPATPDAADTGDDDLRDAVRRLVRLLDRPESLAVLKAGLVREIHHWLLRGRQGAAIRNMGLPDSHARRIARAVAILRAEPARPVRIEQLAAVAGMGRSAFHQHFRATTSLSPLQFQKALRLMEARRLILSQGKSMSQVAFEVGYESASQFSREYARMHGQPPTRDKRQASGRVGMVRTAGIAKG